MTTEFEYIYYERLAIILESNDQKKIPQEIKKKALIDAINLTSKEYTTNCLVCGSKDIKYVAYDEECFYQMFCEEHKSIAELKNKILGNVSILEFENWLKLKKEISQLVKKSISDTQCALN